MRYTSVYLVHQIDTYEFFIQIGVTGVTGMSLTIGKRSYFWAVVMV